MKLPLAPPEGRVGIWVLVRQTPGTAFPGAVSGLTQTRGGLAAGVWGCARLAAQCVGPSWKSCGCTRAMGPVSPRLGAFRCGGPRLAVALTFRPRKRVPHPKGTVLETVPWTLGLLVSSGSSPWCGGLAGPGRTVWRVQVGR